jgi:hypothetical protein
MVRDSGCALEWEARHWAGKNGVKNWMAFAIYIRNGGGHLLAAYRVIFGLWDDTCTKPTSKALMENGRLPG